MDWPGQSGHIHLSLADKAGKPLFHDPAKPKAMSDMMRHFIGGQQALMPQILAMISPTVNSYSRARARLLGADQRDLGHREPDPRRCASFG